MLMSALAGGVPPGNTWFSVVLKRVVEPGLCACWEALYRLSILHVYQNVLS